MLCIFCKSVVENVILCAVGEVVIRASDPKTLKPIKKQISVLGTALGSLELIVKRRILKELQNIMDDITHPICNTVNNKDVRIVKDWFLSVHY